MTITADNVDLSNCDREQIQFVGAILPHGVLLVLSEPELNVVQASANAQSLLGASTGCGLEQIFNPARMARVRTRLGNLDLSHGPCHLMRAALHEHEFDVFAHRCDGVLLMEFEGRGPMESSEADLYSELRVAVRQLETAPNLQALLELAVVQVRQLTGFDRVMAYQFMEDSSGFVIAESLAEGIGQSPFLGLHYPASDIPEPARRLFTKTRVRHQPDIGYTPVPIHPALNPSTGRPLDLTYALLRSVPVMYSLYLKNMGTDSSLVMTVLKEGKLWGLIACHHHSGTRHVPFEARSACEFLAHMLSMLIGSKEDLEHAGYKAKLRRVGTQLVEQLTLGPVDPLTGTGNEVQTMRDYVRAGGVAMVMDGRVETLGVTPTHPQILALAEWLWKHDKRDVYWTDWLAGQYEAAAGFSDTGSGVLAVAVAAERRHFLLWFRPEQIETVNWAGDPRKPVDIIADGQKLILRASFALWRETVRQRSTPWLQPERQAVQTLHSSILELAQLTRLYRELKQSHDELDSFSYVASHDLKEPLRGISNYAQMLRDDYAEAIDETAKERLETLVRLSQRMDDLLDSLLNYSRVGRTSFATTRVDLNQVVAETLELLRPRLEEHQVDIRIPAPLPTVQGDRDRVGEVFANLLSNALKYNNREARWVEIGAEPAGADGYIPIYVRDNGIGISPQHQEAIFQIFKRLHGRGQYGGGAGVGLTIAKKIVERHGGRMAVDSIAGEGSCFRFTLEGGDHRGSAVDIDRQG